MRLLAMPSEGRHEMGDAGTPGLKLRGVVGIRFAPRFLGFSFMMKAVIVHSMGS